MAVFKLSEEIIFPDPKYSEKDGLLAIGGDLSPQRLLTAYYNGIFPWYESGYPIMWWSLNPRMILYPKDFRVTKSFRQRLRNTEYEVKFDSCFEQVIKNCAEIKRKDQKGTWITKEMQNAYIELHKQGYAHSVEVFMEGELAGGLYGISIGRYFSGESMFHKKPDTSKIALYHLCDFFIKNNFDFIDAQQVSEHLISLGAKEKDRDTFLSELAISVEKESIIGKWEYK